MASRIYQLHLERKRVSEREGKRNREKERKRHNMDQSRVWPRSCTYPHKAGREPALLVVDLAPPPVLVGGIQDFDDVPCLKSQLPIRHGHMVPYCLCADD